MRRDLLANRASIWPTLVDHPAVQGDEPRAAAWHDWLRGEAPLAGKGLTLGHELAILAYIERKCPAVGGADERSVNLGVEGLRSGDVGPGPWQHPGL